jgi:opacity protein-like surface antigen
MGGPPQKQGFIGRRGNQINQGLTEPGNLGADLQKAGDMRGTGTFFAGICAVALMGSCMGFGALAQPIDGGYGDGGYTPAPTGSVAPPGADPMSSHGSGLPYFTGLRGSFAFQNNASTFTPGATPSRVQAKYNAGGGGSIYYGARLPLGLRVELEGLYRYQPLHNVSVNGAPQAGATGSAQYAAPMVNLLWELPVTDELPIQPFVGVGAGAAYTETNVNDGTNTFLKNNNWNLAWGFMAGANVPLSQSSRLSAMYRFMQVRDVKYGCAASGAVLANCLKTNLNSQGVDLGLEMDL